MRDVLYAGHILYLGHYAGHTLYADMRDILAYHTLYAGQHTDNIIIMAMTYITF